MVRLPYSFAPPCEPDSPTARVVASGRAVHLREQADPALAAYLTSEPHVAAVLLGLWDAVELRVAPPLAAALRALAVQWTYRLGADLRFASREGGRGLLYGDARVRRRLFAAGDLRAHAPTRALEASISGTPSPPPGVLEAASGWAHRALRSERALRERCHAVPPALVLSTAGHPELVEHALGAYLDLFARWEHGDVPIYLIDDAEALAPANADIVARLRRRYDNPITHLAEHGPDGPGPKAERRAALRRALARVAGRDLGDFVERTFGPGLAGGANFGFWALRGRPTVWIDQDALPYTLRPAAHAWPLEEGEGFASSLPAYRTIETEADLLVSPPPSMVVEPVDVLFLADRYLDARPEDVALRCAAREDPTSEDPGYERVWGAGEAESGPIRILTFHVMGHRDHRARRLHEEVLGAGAAGERARRALQGDLSIYEVPSAPAPAVVVGAGKTAFGTAIGFSGQLPIDPNVMLATRIRLVDFSVGVLQAAVGRFSIAWAPAALAHYRAPLTTSGRGPLAGYTLNEDLLAPLLDEVLECADRASTLDALARALTDSSARYHFPAALAARLFTITAQSIEWLEAMPEPAARAYAGALRERYAIAAGGAALRSRLQEACRLELARFGAQLENWRWVSAVRAESITPS